MEFSIFKAQASRVAFRGLERWLEGEGNPIALNHTVNNITDLHNDAWQKPSEIRESVYTLLTKGYIVSVFAPHHYIDRGGCVDLLIMNLEGEHLSVSAINYAGSKVIASGDTRLRGECHLWDAIGSILDGGLYLSGVADIGFFGAKPDHFIAVADDMADFPSEWQLVKNIDFAKTSNNNTDSAVEDFESAEINSNETITEGYNIMSKVNAVVSANKSAAITVAKIEAGRIGIKQVTSIITPAVPMLARGYLDTPAGRLVVANVFKFAVDSFAANNDKAVLVADAMLEGAMLEMLQSFNVEKLISEVLEKVDISKLVPSAE
jgi:hypothetical protein